MLADGEPWPGPFGTFDWPAVDAFGYADIVIASAPGPIPEFSFATPIITSVAAVVYLFIRQRLGKRKE